MDVDWSMSEADDFLARKCSLEAQTEKLAKQDHQSKKATQEHLEYAENSCFHANLTCR